MVQPKNNAHGSRQVVYGDLPRFRAMGLLPDTLNCGLRTDQECRGRFPNQPTSKETAS